MASDQDTLDGENIGSYRLLRLLGRGGMGEVVEAWDDRLGRAVAIKRIRHDNAVINEEARRRFRREARATAQLNHPAIVQIFDIVSEGSVDALVMERIDGRSVADRLADQGPLPMSLAVRLLREIAEGLAEAHAAGLIHRDLKAENIMVTRSGHAKILDFGLAKHLNDGRASLTRSNALMGTVRAMAPEQAAGGLVDARSDLFSLGVLAYEMLTGVSPFQGRNALQTLLRLQNELPRPVAELRPELPRELSELITRLLAKSPDDRPHDTSEVALLFDQIAALPAVRAATSTPSPAKASTAFGDSPTGSFPGLGPPATPPPSDAQRLSRRRWLVGVGAAVLLIALAVTLNWRQNGPTPPKRVAVPGPEIAVEEPDGSLRLLASGVHLALVSALIERPGLSPVEPADIAEFGAMPDTAVAIARITAADEVLRSTIERLDGGLSRVLLRRIRGSDGQVLWSGSVNVPSHAIEARMAAEAISLKLDQAYAGEAPRQMTLDSDVDDEDYAAFLAIRDRVETASTSWRPELEHLQEIIDRSPGFYSATFMAAEIAHAIYTDRRTLEDLTRATQLASRARQLAPEDPRALGLLFMTALAATDTRRARQLLDELERSHPDPVQVAYAQSVMAEHEGDLAAAVASMEVVVERRPAWRYLYRLANLEALRGEVERARQHLERLLDLRPENTWAQAKLAGLELLYGDPQRAESLYLQLTQAEPVRSDLTNLGLARYLIGRYEEARQSYLQALAIEPGHLHVRLNLADTELALGHRDEAEKLYREILEQLTSARGQRQLSATEKLAQAQCLAYLGRLEQAVAVTLEGLREQPDNAEVAYLAALVYAVAGERHSALVQARAAVARGIGRRWLHIPAFESMQLDPDFRALLGAEQPPR